jgi:hypothetical protein
LRHGVRALGEVAELVGAPALDRVVEVARAEPRQARAQRVDRAHEASAQHERQREHDGEAREADPEAIRLRAHLVRGGGGERPLQVCAVDGGDLRERVVHARALRLHDADALDDALARLVGDEAPRHVERGRVVVLERVIERRRLRRVDGASRLSEPREEARLQRARPGERVAIVSRDRVLEAAPELVERALELGLEHGLGDVKILDRRELPLRARRDEPARDDQQDEGDPRDADDRQELSAEREPERRAHCTATGFAPRRFESAAT